MDQTDRISFFRLEWDTKFFGVTCAKAILHQPLSENEWNDLTNIFAQYQFVSIENRNSEPLNAQMIGKYTSAFLADVNIQFEKIVEGSLEELNNIEIHNTLKRNEEILKLADFKYSKFIEDIKLAERGGKQVYTQWILNSFENPEKYFVISRDCNKSINGFVLYSLHGIEGVIELIAVSKDTVNSGIGTKLFRAVEYTLSQSDIKKIRVGTQLRNIPAINFYHKVGCKQIGCHQIYHLWNI